MPSTQKQLSVAAIKNGTVIDHISAGQALKIVRILSLPSHEKMVTIGLNLPSRAMGLKDLIKVEGRELTQQEVNEVAIFAPKASVNIIRNFSVVKKFHVEMPKTIDRLLICPNPKCVTNNERMQTHFKVKEAGNATVLQCGYCERVCKQEDITSYNV